MCSRRRASTSVSAPERQRGRPGGPKHRQPVSGSSRLLLCRTLLACPSALFHQFLEAGSGAWAQTPPRCYHRHQCGAAPLWQVATTSSPCTHSNPVPYVVCGTSWLVGLKCLLRGWVKGPHGSWDACDRRCAAPGRPAPVHPLMENPHSGLTHGRLGGLPGEPPGTPQRAKLMRLGSGWAGAAGQWLSWAGVRAGDARAIPASHASMCR